MTPPRRYLRFHHQDDGFTLVELMVFSSIWLLLSSIAFQSMFTLIAQRKLRTASIELSGYLEVARNVALAENSPCTITLLKASDGIFGPDPAQQLNSCKSDKITIPPSLDLRQVSGSNNISVSLLSNSGSFPLTFTPEGTIREGATVLISSNDVRVGSWCVEVQSPLGTVRRGWRSTGSESCDFTLEQ